MGKITGTETLQEIPPKVLSLYEAVLQLINEGEDLNDIRVSSITEKAGIGKGTAYDYFESKEDMIASAFIFYISKLSAQVNNSLLHMDTLEEQVDFLIDNLGDGSERKSCFAHFFHLLTDNSKVSQLMQRKWKELSGNRKFSEYLFGQMIEHGQACGQIRTDLPAGYIVYTVFCKVLTYMMCLKTGDGFGMDMEKMRDLVKDGILREISG